MPPPAYLHKNCATQEAADSEEASIGISMITCMSSVQLRPPLPPPGEIPALRRNDTWQNALMSSPTASALPHPTQSLSRPPDSRMVGSSSGRGPGRRGSTCCASSFGASPRTTLSRRPPRVSTRSTRSRTTGTRMSAGCVFFGGGVFEGGLSLLDRRCLPLRACPIRKPRRRVIHAAVFNPLPTTQVPSVPLTVKHQLRMSVYTADQAASEEDQRLAGPAR